MVNKIKAPKGAVLLDDPNIPSWKEPTPPGTVNMLLHGWPEWHTRVLEYTGIEKIGRELDRFNVRASAATYLVEVPTFEGNYLQENEMGKVRLVRAKLFNGGIEIYKSGELKIDDKEIKGDHLVRTGRIWHAVPLSTDQTPDLESAVFGREKIHDRMEDRLDQIMAGYGFLDKMEKEARRK